jgi:hypothetical protein
MESTDIQKVRRFRLRSSHKPASTASSSGMLMQFTLSPSFGVNSFL